MGKPEHIELRTLIDIRDKYQYFTEANMSKLKSIGYTTPFHTLRKGFDYVTGYLILTKTFELTNN